MSEITLTVTSKPIETKGFASIGTNLFIFNGDPSDEGKDYVKGRKFNTNILKGDRVRISYRGYESRDLGFGLEFTVTDWSYSEISKYRNYDSRRTGIYQQVITLDGGKSIKAINVEKIEGCYSEGNKPEMLKIGVERPAIVWEIVDGEYVGSPSKFKNEEEAKKYAKDQIVGSVREANTYRNFKIFVEKSVAGATEPPVTFE